MTCNLIFAVVECKSWPRKSNRDLSKPANTENAGERPLSGKESKAAAKEPLLAQRAVGRDARKLVHRHRNCGYWRLNSAGYESGRPAQLRSASADRGDR